MSDAFVNDTVVFWFALGIFGQVVGAILYAIFRIEVRTFDERLMQGLVGAALLLVVSWVLG